jgi:hypothetical protein
MKIEFAFFIKNIYAFLLDNDSIEKQYIDQFIGLIKQFIFLVDLNNSKHHNQI